jgi:benzoate transport
MTGTAVYDAPTRAVAKTAWVVVALCTIINMMDGFDVLAISFAAPEVAREWGLQPTQLGLLFSAGLAGMTVGALVLSPLADILGRRTILLTCLFVISAAMILSAYAQGLTSLALFRFLTGLGIGGMLSGINTVTAEYAPERQRNFAIGLVTCGYPIGATLGGIAAIPLIAQFGWPSVFLFGGFLSLVMIPIVWVALPESLAFLLSRQPRDALVRANALLRRLERPQLASLPQPAARDGKGRKSLFDIFDSSLIAGTLLIVTAFFMNMLSFYFVMSWTPKVIVDMGLSTQVGISASVAINMFGVVGGILCGYLAGRFGLARVTGIYMLMTFVGMVVFSFMPADFTLLMVASAFLGFFLLGTMVGLYAIVAVVFPTHVRATGTGVAIGIGRLGAIVGPYLGGILIAAGWQRPLYWAALGVPVLIAAVVTAGAAQRARRIEAP